MSLSPQTLALDRIRKFLTVDIVAKHKTRRTAGVLDTATLRVTDARWLIDPAGPHFYDARLQAGYRRTRSTGTASGTGSLLGTGIGPGTEPNRFRFSVFAGEDRAGNTLRGWQDYQLKGAEVIVRMGAIHDERGQPIPFSEFNEVFYGFISEAPRAGDDVWQFVAVSPEGHRQDAPLVRRTYRGLGYGVQIANSVTTPPGTAAAWLEGAAQEAFAPAGGYAWSTILSIPTRPSQTGTDGEILHLEAATETRLEAWFCAAEDRLHLFHHDGSGSTEIEFTAWTLRNLETETPFRIGARHGGSTAFLYVNGEQVDSADMARTVGTDGTELQIGRRSPTERPLDAIVYELWMDETDVGDETFRRRQAGPLRGDAQSQGGLWCWYEFPEGSQLAPPTTTADLRFNLNLDLGGSAVFVSSREGDHPDVSPKPRGDTHGAIVGKCFNVPAAPLEVASAIFEVARDGVSIDWARLDGGPAQLAYSRTGSWALTQTPVNGIENDGLAPLVIARDETTGQQGSEIEITGDAGSPSCNGTYEVLSVTQGRYIELGTPIGAPRAEMTGIPREDRTATCTVTVPRYLPSVITLDAAPAINKGGGLVGFPATGHGLNAAIARVKLEGSASFDGAYALDPSTSADELVVTANFGSGETFTGTEAISVSVAQVTDLGDGRVQLARLPTARLTLDVTGVVPNPGLRESYTYLRTARDRLETAPIDDAKFTPDETFLVSWIGDIGERDEAWSLAIPPGQDMAYKEALGRLLRSYFAWSSDAERTALESEVFPQVRMGQFGAPAAGGPVHHGRLVTSERIEELSSESPAWRLIAEYRPNGSPIASTPAAIPPAVQEQLAADYSSIEVARDEATRADFDDARDLVWRTQFYSAESAALVGQRVWEFVKQARLWRRWSMALLPHEAQIGANFSIEAGSHAELSPSGAAHFFPATVEDGIVDRGVTLICIS